ncbi:hypothetical protein AX16_004120 [Volvariella volvacea WC 439]|nr:hypothetical protein AX16_004120 [Volvariella volvacea WC 439]
MAHHNMHPSDAHPPHHHQNQAKFMSQSPPQAGNQGIVDGRPAGAPPPPDPVVMDTLFDPDASSESAPTTMMYSKSVSGTTPATTLPATSSGRSPTLPFSASTGVRSPSASAAGPGNQDKFTDYKSDDFHYTVRQVDREHYHGPRNNPNVPTEEGLGSKDNKWNYPGMKALKEKEREEMLGRVVSDPRLK